MPPRRKPRPRNQSTDTHHNNNNNNESISSSSSPTNKPPVPEPESNSASAVADDDDYLKFVIPEFDPIPGSGLISEPAINPVSEPDVETVHNEIQNNNVDSDINASAETKLAQEDLPAVNVDDFEVLDNNNNPMVVNEVNISESPCKNNDALFSKDVDSGNIKATEEIMTTHDSALVVSTQTLCDNDIDSTVKDDYKEKVDVDGSDFDEGDDDDDDVSEGDDAVIEGDKDKDQDPVVVQDSAPDNNQDKNKEIYVGNLDKDTIEDDLVNVFQRFGELKSTKVVRNFTSNKSKGFAFIQFASVDCANRALSELKDGVEVKGKLAKVSARQSKDALYLGNICKRWGEEEVLQQLKDYGIERIEAIRLPGNTKGGRKIRGFAFLEFSTHSDAVAAYQRLQKPDAVFGRDISAKVAFLVTPVHSSGDGLSHVNRVCVDGLTKDWNEEKIKELCNQYGEVVSIKLCQSSRFKQKDSGFITFASSESAVACVAGINNSATEGDSKIIASIAKPEQKGKLNKQGLRGGFKVEKQNEALSLNKAGGVSNKMSEPKSSKMKGVLNTPQTKKSNYSSSKSKIKAKTNKPQQKGSTKKNGESSKEAAPLKMKGDSNSQQGERKRKASSGQKLNVRDHGSTKKPKNDGEGQNSKTVSKAGSRKRKQATTNEGREDRGNRNVHGKKPFKKQKGNMPERERDNYRDPRRDTLTIRGHDDHRASTRYIDPYAPKYASTDAYHPVPGSLSTRHLKEMEPHAGYIEPVTAKPSRIYSEYVPPVVRTHNQHQTAYHESASTIQSHNQHHTLYREPPSTSQTRSQLYSRYLDHSHLTQSNRGYIETAAVPGTQRYRGYHSSEYAQIAHDPYDSGISRVVRHDGSRAGVSTYAGGSPLLASYQLRDSTRYYQAGGSYRGAQDIRRTYY
uniref:nucleolin-like n=1 Tax=Erigeron canadensis TaxID=72917 RepID=UPI001CB995AA|nr:nucleolin-like [Erigeron canadensis]